MGLVQRLYALVLVAVAPALALALVAYSEFQARQDRTLEVEAQSIAYARLVSGELDRMVEGFRNLLTGLAHQPAVRALDGPGCSAYLAELAPEYPEFLAIATVAADDLPFCANIPLKGGTRVDRSYFNRALQAGGFVIGEYLVSRSTSGPGLTFADVFDDAQGKVGGVVVATIDLGWLHEHFAARTRDLPPGSALTIVDRNGTILVRVPNRELEGKPIPERLRGLLEEKTGGTFATTAEQATDGIARIAGFTTLTEPPGGLLVVVGLPKTWAFAAVWGQTWRGMAAVGAGGLLALLAVWWGGRAFIVRPVEALLTAVTSWRSGDVEARASVSGSGTELARLGAAYNDMAASVQQSQVELRAALEQREMLFDELNHRTKNNLQLVTSLLHLQARMAGDRRIGDQLDEASRRVRAIADIHDTLHQDRRHVAEVPFGPYLQRLCDGLDTAFTSGGDAAARVEVWSDDSILPLDRAVPLGIIVNELVTNAFKHAFPDRAAGRVQVRFQRVDNGGYRLTVADDGRGTASDRMENAEGLGMRLVRLLAQQIRASVDVATIDGVQVRLDLQPSPAVPSRAPCGTSEDQSRPPADAWPTG